MFTNWLTYCRIAEELDAQLRGARISEVYTQQKNELVIDLTSDVGTRSLIFSTLPRMASLQLKEDFARARRNSLDLLPDLVGDNITNVAIAGSDRIIRLSLASGRALFALLFPVRANLLLYNGETLVDSYKQYDIGADVHRQDYDAITAPPTLDELHASISRHDNELRPALRALHPWLSGRFTEELYHRCGVTADRDSGAFTTDEATRLHGALVGMLEEADSGSSHVYLDEQRPVAFSLVKMTNLSDLREERFDSALEGIGYFLRRHFSGGDFSLTRDRVRKTVQREIDRIDRILEKLASPTQLKKQADEYEKFGNLLMIHLYDMPTQPGSMTVPDIFVDPRLVLTIPLKPRTTVLENSQMYFGKAQSTRASIEYVISRNTSMEKRKARLSAFLTAIDAAANSPALKELFKEYTAIMEELGLTAKGEKNEAPFPFRRFVVEGGFEVWAGKNSANNDLLTVRHSRPNDIWFHARGVGGSHVVIKVGSAAGEPSKEAIRQAASIAAYYSKHRNAKRVPVAYTEKKYVRKPKGAAPGSVAVEREKVIMVDPRLPEGAKDED